MKVELQRMRSLIDWANTDGPTRLTVVGAGQSACSPDSGVTFLLS